MASDRMLKKTIRPALPLLTAVALALVALAGLGADRALAQELPTLPEAAEAAQGIEEGTTPLLQQQAGLEVPDYRASVPPNHREVREALSQQFGLPNFEDTGPRAENFWMPAAASTAAAHTDFLFDFVLYVTIFFTVLVVAMMVVFAVKYRYKEGDPDTAGKGATHSTTLEITWTVIPTCIVLVMFTLGFRGYLDMTISPPNAYEIQVNARSWAWDFVYPDGSTTPDLHLPKDVPVRLVLRSADVIHSLYIPAFRVKKDVVPGRFNTMWFEPNREGIYELFCTEYCGTLHSRMGAKVFVYDGGRFADTLARISDPFTDFATGVARSMEEAGAAIAASRGCLGCHATSEARLQGPGWGGIWGTVRQFTDGTSAVVDENYIRESILYPGARVVVGYPNNMPSYLGQLSDREIDALIAYIRSLGTDTRIGPDGQPIQPAETTALGEGDNEPRRPE